MTINSFLRALVAALVLLLASCGGGVETGGTGPTGSSYVEGPVNGFGSVFVAGIRFDDGSARIEDADGVSRSRDDLRLGMVVGVEASTIGTDAGGTRNAVATRIRLGSELLGPITATGPGGNVMAVLGQQVRLTTSTVVDGVPGAAALQVGDIVEVHGFFDARAIVANYVATRVERRTSAPPAYRVRGIARDVDSAARTLRIGAQTFDLGATGLPPGLNDGAYVRLVVQTTQVNGRWPVTTIAVDERRLPDRDEAELEGLITSFTSTARFAVNGIAVDASNASFPKGTSGIELGARVQVKGRASVGGVVAASVEPRSDDDSFNLGVDLRDAIANLDTAAKTFTLRGVTVFYGSAPPPRYDNGTEADLVNGRRVRVRATLDLDRVRVVAQRITFD